MPTTDLWPRLRQRFACVAALGGIAALAACGGGGDASPDAPSSEPADSEQRAQALATSTWTKIASEGQSFTVSGVLRAPPPPPQAQVDASAITDNVRAGLHPPVHRFVPIA